jgi:alpha-1,2-mannosyltransferase
VTNDLPRATAEPLAGQHAPVLRARRRPSPNGVAIVTLTLAALALLLFQSLFHAHLSTVDEYDDGAYFGASLQLLHGILPYRDVVFIQPPMLTVWLLPAAAVSLFDGTAAAFETARIFIDVVATANVLLVGLLVRRRPTIQIVVSMGAMAAFPGAVRSAQTVLIEPMLVFLCLAGLLCLLDSDRLTRSWPRILTGGAMFGLAGATKVWAIFPFLAVLVVAARLGPKRWIALVGSGAAAFAACALPFFIAAPKAFIRQVFVIQATRQAGGGFTPWERVADLLGLPGLQSLVQTPTRAQLAALHRLATPAKPSTHTTLGSPGSLAMVVIVVVVVALLALCLLAFTGRRREPITALDAFALIATAVTAAGLLVAPQYYYHYGGFEAPFIALLYGTVVARLGRRVHASHPQRDGVRVSRVRLAVSGAIALVAIAVIVAMFEVSVDVTASSARRLPAAQIVGSVLPRRGCILYTNPGIGILADRFTADVHGCSTIVDYLAQERALDHGADQSRSDLHSAALQAKWLSTIKASVALVAGANPSWDATVTRYVNKNFHRVPRKATRFRVFVRNHRSAVRAPRDK